MTMTRKRERRRREPEPLEKEYKPWCPQCDCISIPPEGTEGDYCPSCGESINWVVA
jgi:hypothetical protein